MMIAEFSVQEFIREALIRMPIFLFSLSVHEAAHAWVANRLGDPTARMMGRITLNPISHIDWIGTILVPLFGGLFSGVALIGWAKPVPVNRLNLRRWRRDDTLVAIAGPISNIILAFGFFILLSLFLLLFPGLVSSELGQMIGKFGSMGILINLALAVFNMIPVPPLDGSHVVANHLLPPHIAERYEQMGMYGLLLLLLVINIPIFGSIYGGIIYYMLLPFAIITPGIFHFL